MNTHTLHTQVVEQLNYLTKVFIEKIVAKTSKHFMLNCYSSFYVRLTIVLIALQGCYGSSCAYFEVYYKENDYIRASPTDLKHSVSHQVYKKYPEGRTQLFFATQGFVLDIHSKCSFQIFVQEQNACVYMGDVFNVTIVYHSEG